MIITDWIKKANQAFKKGRPVPSKDIKWEVTSAGMQAFFQDAPSTPEEGVNIRWAIVTTATDANNYVCDIYFSRGSYVNGDDAMAEDEAVRVPDIVDELAVGDGIPVTTSVLSDEDYECIQQMGAVG